MAKNNDGSSMLGSLRAPSLGTDFNRNADKQRLLSASEELANAQNKMRANEAAIAALTSQNQELADSRTSGNLDFVSKLLGSDKNIIARNNEEIARLQSEIQRIGVETQGITPEALAAQRTPKDPSFAGEFARNVAGLVTGKSFANAFADPSGSLSDLSRANEGGAITSTALAALSGRAPGPRAFMNAARTGRNFLRAGETTSSFGQALGEARVATEVEKALGAQARSSTKQVASKPPQPSSLVNKLSKNERVSGAAQELLARTGLTPAASQQIAAAAPYIDAFGGDVQAGLNAYKASLKAGKNVAIPSPSGAAPASPATPPPNAPQSGHVSPRGASGGAAGMENPGPTGFSTPMPGVPTSGTPIASATVPSSSTLSKLLKSAGLVSSGVVGGMGLADLFRNAESSVQAEQAQPAPQPTPQQTQLQLPLDDSSSVANAYGAANTGSTPNAVPQVAPSFESQLLALLSGGSQQQTPSGPSPMISDEDIAQIQKLVGAVAPQQAQQVAQQQKPSLTSNILNAIGKGLVAGGTGDPRAAFVNEDNARQEALAQEQLRQSRQQFSPQQQFVNQLLAQVLGSRLGVSGQKELLGAQNQASQQAQARQIAAQLMLMDREQQAAIARDDRETAVKYELQKRDAMARLEQIKAQTSGQLEFMLSPQVQQMMQQLGGGSQALPQINE